jgi:hypothetical protein
MASGCGLGYGGGSVDGLSEHVALRLKHALQPFGDSSHCGELVGVGPSEDRFAVTFTFLFLHSVHPFRDLKWLLLCTIDRGCILLRCSLEISQARFEKMALTIDGRYDVCRLQCPVSVFPIILQL